MCEDLHLILCWFSFAMGSCIASFLNVVIWRVPRGESIVSPSSHCPKCNSPIRWYQNIPIVSWLALRGKCANCGVAISPRYILVEALGGALFLAAFCKFGPWAPLMWVWIALMIVGSFIDFDHKLLPDFVTVGGMAYGLAISYWWFGMGWMGVLYSAIGLAVGFGLLWLIRFFGSKAFGREAMGLGDVFLMGAVGAIFGPIAVLVTLILSSLLGSVVGMVMVAMSKAKIGKFAEIPYGPYICMGCLMWMFLGQQLVNWYLHILK